MIRDSEAIKPLPRGYSEAKLSSITHCLTDCPKTDVQQWYDDKFLYCECREQITGNHCAGCYARNETIIAMPFVLPRRKA